MDVEQSLRCKAEVPGLRDVREGAARLVEMHWLLRCVSEIRVPQMAGRKVESDA